MVAMKSYTLYRNSAKIELSNGKALMIFFSPDSGKVYYRYKIGTISDVKHTGIFLGTDRLGIKYFMHNHYKTKQPSIVTQYEFSQGLPLFLYEGEGECVNTPIQTIKLGLDQVLQGEPYTWHSYNCQTFVNRARSNVNKSEDVER